MAVVEARVIPSAAAGRLGLLSLLVALACLGACAQPGRPPVVDRSAAFGPLPERYTVAAGDTLYAIAWRFGLDYRALARANGIPSPYRIRVGQEIRLRQAVAAAAPRVPAREATPAPRPPAPRPGGAPAAAGEGPWQAPTNAPVSRGFGSGNKGIDYRLGSGHRVRAAAAGEVVYAGSGLGGFRQLVIVKHDAAFLSAYSFDRPLTVREGQQVAAGADVAGRDGGTVLHFEIRRNGQPVNPAGLIGGGG